MRNKVKQYRTERGLSQQQLAECIGVSRQSIIAIENGKYVPSTVLALKLSTQLSQPVEALFSLEETD